MEYNNVRQCRYVFRDNNKGMWKCMASGCVIYNKWRKGLNAYKVLHHYNDTPGQNVVACTRDVADNMRKAMSDLLLGVTTVNFLSSGGVVPAIYAFFV